MWYDLHINQQGMKMLNIIKYIIGIIASVQGIHQMIGNWVWVVLPIVFVIAAFPLIARVIYFTYTKFRGNV